MDARTVGTLSRRRFLVSTGLAAGGLILGGPGCTRAGRSAAAAPPDLAAAFDAPPLSARPGAYWVWVNGQFDRKQMTRELEDARAKGLSGFEVFDVGTTGRRPPVPAGPPFMGPESAAAVGHAVREAGRLGLAMGLITSSSWNAGGPWVTPEMASKSLYASTTEVRGPAAFDTRLPDPKVPQPKFAGRRGGLDPWPAGETWSQETAVLAVPTAKDKVIRDLSAVVDLSDRTDSGGRLRWQAPAGEWTVLRIVCTNNRERLRLPSPNSDGYMIDHLDARATEAHFRHILGRLRAEVDDLEASALSYLYLPSYEIRGLTEWTPSFAEEFRRRRGYDPIPFLPVLFGWTLADEAVSERFDHDRRLTVSDLLIENHYATAAEVCRAAGLELHAEAGGPGKPFLPAHDFPAESLRALGVLDVPRGEFWVRRPPEENDPANVIKEIACAAHIYNRRIVEMESFTGFDHWERGPFDLKPYADRALCAGMNRFVFHTSPHQPPEAGRPGWTYHAGTHMGMTRAWWPMAEPFIAYLARCSALLQAGRFVGDVCFYYGHEAPRLIANKGFDPRTESLGPGYDYDYCNTDVLLNRMTVRGGRITVADGPDYALLVLPDRDDMPLKVLERLEQLVREGATIVGRRPTRSPGLGSADTNAYRERDAAVRRLADRLWGDVDGRQVTERTCGRGMVVQGRPLAEILRDRGLGPDVAFTARREGAEFDWIHRRAGETDLYFVANLRNRPETVDAVFRVTGKRPEVWDPATGERRPAAVYDTVADGTRVRLDLPPWGAAFVVFRPGQAADHVVALARDGRPLFPVAEGAAGGETNTEASAPTEPSIEIRSDEAGVMEARLRRAGTYTVRTAARHEARFTLPADPPVHAVGGPWHVTFPEGRGAPPAVDLPKLISWTEHPDAGVRHFSGIATYERTVDLPADLFADDRRLLLDLGGVGVTAEVHLNGRRLGIVWRPPYRLDVTGIARPGANRLRMAVANVWANRLIGDRGKSRDQRLTRTCLPDGALPKGLVPSGLMGPVRIVTEARRRLGLHATPSGPDIR
ncbi:MAG: glycosyl hydrolase [Phycisphaerae bacterium]